MTTPLTLRAVKGSPLTHDEVDANFTALRTTADGAVQVLAADLNLYVRPDGDDANDGRSDTAGGAFLTIQRAANEATRYVAGEYYDHGIIITIAAGTYAENVEFGGVRVFSGHSIRIEGAGVTVEGGISAIGIGVRVNSVTVVDGAFTARMNGQMRLQGCQLVRSYLEASAEGHIAADDSVFSGDTYCAAYAYWAGRIEIGMADFVDTPAYSEAFAWCENSASIKFTDTINGAATGKKFFVAKNGIIDGSFFAIDYLPGDVAGTAETGGRYFYDTGTLPADGAGTYVDKSGDTMTGLLTLNPGARKFMSWTSIVGGEGEGVAFQSDTKFNIFIGLNSGDANVYAGTGGGNGSANTALGYQSLQYNTDGKYNTAVGTHALNANTTGVSNVGIGSNAGIVIADGDYNVAVGHDALLSCVSGDSNMAIGHRALHDCTTSYNVAIGTLALAQNVGGQYNFALGYNSLSAQTAGNSNIAIGLGAGSGNVQSTSTQNCIIGTYADVSAANASNEFVCGADLFKISNVYFGNGVAHTSPAGYTINGTGGSGSNVAGAAVTIAGGIGTGTGAGGDIVFKTAKAGSTGSTPNALAEAFKVSGTGPMVVLSGGGVTVANLPAGVQGAVAFVTDATVTTFASVVAGGGANPVPVYHDGTNWRIG